VEHALERELSNSRFVNLVPPERVQDVLRLMKKPSDTRLDAPLAREVALRDGNVHIVLTGRTEKLGSSYVLSASLIQPSSGSVLRSFREEAGDLDAVLAAVNRLSRRVRESLGEEPARFRENLPSLEKATTPSLRALQFFSQGMSLVNLRKWKAAIPLLEQALTEDGEFASAHIYLAHCYSNVGKDKEAARHYQEALRLADTTTDRERYFIVGSYHDRFTQDYEKAIQAYEVLVREYPDHYWGVNNLALTLDGVDRVREASPYVVARAELRPNDLPSVYRAAMEMMRFGRDPAKAEALMRKAQELSQNPDASPNPDPWVKTILYGARRRMRLGDYEGARQELERVRRTVPSHAGRRRDALTDWLGVNFVHLGQLRAGEEQYSALRDELMRHAGLAWVAAERGDMTALRFHLRRQLALGAGFDPERVQQLVRVGMLAEAAAQLADERAQKGYPTRWIRLARAHVVTGKGRTTEAIHLLTELHNNATANRDPLGLEVAIPLAEILEQRGDLAGAAQVISQALAANPWPERLADVRQAKFRLARIYRKLGREHEAIALESEIRQSLAVADADHPMLLALEREARIRASK
jgi:tetratricopeptide (TPR) repeat protein